MSFETCKLALYFQRYIRREMQLMRVRKRLKKEYLEIGHCGGLRARGLLFLIQIGDDTLTLKAKDLNGDIIAAAISSRNLFR